ncbi:MAG TPA: hypothetical protein VFG72_06760 [Marmoricola sp.]|nr:hypothetical protein [Marmoricola sp.]
MYPHDGEERLRDLVARALTAFFGHEPSRDEDGDFALVHGSAVLFVRVLTDVPVVQLFSCVMHRVEDRQRAAREVAALNRDERLIKFVLVGDSVLAYLHLSAWPFVAEHLRAAVAMLSEVLDRLDGDHASRVDGPLHPAMQTLLQLDADQPGSVDPALAAGICEYDRGLILELITWNEQQATEWSRARADALEDARNDAAAVCEGRAEQARRTVDLLRRALRITVKAQVAEARRRHGSGRRHASGVSRRAPDPSLEEVNPEMWG